MKNIFFILVAFLFVNTSRAQWTQTKGPYSGSINCIAQNGDYIFTGTTGQGIYISADNGSHWTAANNGLTNLHISSIVMKGSSIFAGTLGGGVFLSTDNGSNWKAINNGLPAVNSQIQCLTICGENIYAGTLNNGIYLSRDNGQNWVLANSGLTDKVIWSIGNNGTYVIAGTQEAGPFMSTDNGVTWKAINNGLPKEALNVKAIAFKGGDLFIGTGGGIFRSSDNGNTWVAVNSGLSGYGIFINDLLMDGDQIYAGTNDGVYISNDNGESWTRQATGFVYAYTVVYALAIKDNYLFAGTESTGMFLSSDHGTNWEPVNTGIIGSTITAMVVKDGNIFAGNASNGVFKSSDMGENWTAVNNGLWNKDVAALAVVEDNLFAGAGCGGIFLSTDNGKNWELASNGMTYRCISSLVADGVNLYAGTQGGVYFLDNQANSWTSVSSGLPASAGDLKLAVNGNNIFAGTSNGMYLSTNKGNTWSAINSGLIKPIKAIAINGNSIFAGTQGDGIYISKNNGSTWSQANVGLSNSNIRAFTRSGSNIYVATEKGVFLSKDNGLTWTQFNDGWDNKSVLSLTLCSGYLYAGTFEGVWKHPLNEEPKIMISGVVTNSDGETIEGVTLNGLPGNPVTDRNGYYTDSVSAGWSGKITPYLNGYIFTPLTRSYSTLNANQENQDFQGEFHSVRTISVSATSITINQNGGVSSKSPSFTFINNGLQNADSSSVNKSARIFNHSLGCLIPDSIVQYWKNHQPAPVAHLKSYSPTIDWSNYDSPVKDQGDCGACWAFATCAYIENIGEQTDLSEQTLLSCGNSGTCGGGYYDRALAFIQNEGIPGESCYPYTQVDGICSNMCANFTYKEKIRKVSNELWGIATVDLLKSELQNGPLIVSMQVPLDNSFDNYQGGIYHYNGGLIPEGRGHAVLLVGYNDDQKCFKVKNSWGEEWGENGYFRISYDDVTNEVEFGSYAMNGSGVYTEQLSNSAFVISATGNDNLTIESISSNKEWLTTSGYPDDTFALAPSTSKDIRLLVNWDKLGSLTQTGIITVQSNDPEKPLVTIQVTAIPLCTSMLDATVSVDGNTSICMGDYSVLNATTGDNLVYQWKKNGNNIPDANGSSYIVTSGGAYSVEVSQIGTSCFAESLPVAMVVNPIPPKLSISISGKNLMSNRSKGNQWYDKNGLIPGATNQYYHPTEEGDFYVVSVVNGCNSLPSNIFHYVPTDVNAITFGKSIIIRPNPFDNELVIECSSYSGKVSFEMINATGQIVVKGDFIENIRVNTGSLIPGAYLIRLVNGKNTEFRKLIKK